MKIKKVKLITEESRRVGDVLFLNSTEDQFPYVESALNSLDNNFNWWKENWPELEELMSKYLSDSLKDQFEVKKVDVSSRFTVFHGADSKVKDVIWTGPAIVYTFEGAGSSTVNAIKNSFGGIYKGHKMFTDGEQLVVLFG